jgi:DNA-binding PucR family transcriptional regulator
LPVLMASSPDAAATVISATLGPVLELPAERREPIIKTVRTWLQRDQSVSATAAEMHCHRNTVNYRLRRFSELTGRSLADNVWLAQVVLAIEAPPVTEPT